MNPRHSFVRVAVALFSAAFLHVTHASAAVEGTPSSPFKNLDTLSMGLDFAAYRSKPQHVVKVAILDNGFRGYKEALGKTLPVDTTFTPGPIPVDPETEDSHGFFMAQVFASLLKKSPAVKYELHLISAFGYTNFEKAVQTAIQEKFDLVLYAQVWEYGGNGDGRGFINALVDQATQAGIVWINASGNNGDATFRTAIRRQPDDWAKLPGPNDSVRVRCKPNPSEDDKTKNKCTFRALLAWNDFKDDVKLGTDKDLDLVLTDDTLKIIQTSGLTQKKTFPEGEPGSSLYSREIIQAQVDPGVYFLRVKIRSSNFNPKRDEMRIITSGDRIEQFDLTNQDETILAPADNSSVITVGASDSEKSAASKFLGKPELVSTSLVTLENNENYKGSSTAASVALAVATVIKAYRPGLDRDGVLAQMKNGPDHNGRGVIRAQGFAGQGLSINILNFEPTGPGCFILKESTVESQAADDLSQAGAVTVATSNGDKFLTREDPFVLARIGRRASDDILALGPKGLLVYPRSSETTLPEGTFEVAQLPRGQFFCSVGASTGSENLAPAVGRTLTLPTPGALRLEQN